MNSEISCIIVDDEEMSRKVLEHLVKRAENWKLLALFSNAKDARDFLKGTSVDVIFLDIEMPEITGIEFLKLLQTYPEVVIVSSKEKYAIDAFDFEVTDFLLKPVELDRFLKTVKRIESRLHSIDESYTKSDSVFIKANNQLVNLRFSDIHYVEAYGDYVNIITEKDKYIVHSTMKGIDSKLPKDKFLRVHRSFIVQLEKINSIDETLIVIGKKLIPIGESYRSELMKRLNFL